MVGKTSVSSEKRTCLTDERRLDGLQNMVHCVVP